MSSMSPVSPNNPGLDSACQNHISTIDHGEYGAPCPAEGRPICRDPQRDSSPEDLTSVGSRTLLPSALPRPRSPCEIFSSLRPNGSSQHPKFSSWGSYATFYGSEDGKAVSVGKWSGKLPLTPVSYSLILDHGHRWSLGSLPAFRRVPVPELLGDSDVISRNGRKETPTLTLEQSGSSSDEYERGLRSTLRPKTAYPSSSSQKENPPWVSKLFPNQVAQMTSRLSRQMPLFVGHFHGDSHERSRNPHGIASTCRSDSAPQVGTSAETSLGRRKAQRNGSNWRNPTPVPPPSENRMRTIPTFPALSTNQPQQQNPNYEPNLQLPPTRGHNYQHRERGNHRGRGSQPVVAQRSPQPNSTYPSDSYGSYYAQPAANAQSLWSLQSNIMYPSNPYGLYDTQPAANAQSQWSSQPNTAYSSNLYVQHNAQNGQNQWYPQPDTTYPFNTYDAYQAQPASWYDSNSWYGRGMDNVAPPSPFQNQFPGNHA